MGPLNGEKRRSSGSFKKVVSGMEGRKKKNVFVSKGGGKDESGSNTLKQGLNRRCGIGLAGKIKTPGETLGAQMQGPGP